MFRSHVRNENEFQISGRRGSALNIEKLSFKIPTNPNSPGNHETLHGVMTRHQHAVVKIVQFGTNFAINFSQTCVSLK